MMIAKLEKLFDIKDEIEPLGELHYELLEKNKDRVPLWVNEPMYRVLEDLGLLVTVTIRNDGHLFGYFIGIVSPGLRTSAITCMTDVYYVHHDYRGQGAGSILLEEVEKELERRNVVIWYAGYRMEEGDGAKALLAKRGFKPLEVYCVKFLGDQ